MSVTATAATSTAPPIPRRRRRGPGRGMILALLLAAALAAGGAYAAVTLTRDAAPTLTVGVPAIVSPAEAADAAKLVGHEVFGVGALPGTRLELTRGSRGEVWVRYLSGDAQAGDRRASFVTVGTYKQVGAYVAARDASEGADSRSAELPGGGLMLWNLERPTSVYIASPASDLLVEVYSPDAEQARSLARAGAVVPLR
jgi:hypothetical protein